MVAETRSGSEGGWVFRGVAARTDHDYQPWYGSAVTERVQAGAFRSISHDQVVMLIDHSGLPLASTRAGSLSLEVTDTGLEYRAEVSADDPDAPRLMAKIRSGSVWGSSMGFYVRDQEWRDDGKLRVIKDVEVFDVSAVGVPANPATSVDGESSALRQMLAEVRKNTSDDLRAVVSEIVEQALDRRGIQVPSAASVELLKLQAQRLALA